MKKVVKDIGIGVSGLGLGSLLLRINEDPASRLKVRGIYEPDPRRVHQRYDVGRTTRQLARKFGVDLLTGDYDELLARKDIHIIAIFSPCPCHFEQIKKALLAGKHVIVTKPMVVSIEEAREIVRLVDRTGLRLLVAQSMRWNAEVVAIRELFEKGKLGKLILGEAYYVHDMRPVLDRSPWRYQMPQDLLYGGACHPIDLLRWFLGEVDEVFAYAGPRSGLEPRYPKNKELNYIISLKHRSGVPSRVLAAYEIVHPPSLWRLPFHGVGLGLYGTKATLFNDRVVYDYYRKGEPKEKVVKPKGGQIQHAGEVLGFLHHFEDCIVKGVKPLVDVRDGAAIIAACSAAWKSIRTGKPVKVSREFDHT